MNLLSKKSIVKLQHIYLVIALSLFIVSSSVAQTSRNFHAQRVILDNDGTPLYFYTLSTPSGMVNSDTFSFPLAPPNNPASGFVYTGAHLKDLLQWQVDPVLYPQGAWVSTSPDSLRFARGWGIAGQVTYWVNP
ncbi:MAG TPA: hypothetical protein VFA55_08340, partial [Candidatus Kapabacteria bacterium]|nr:hypothetical protein [Candidatus Kapabacteria bacterium]